MLFWAVQSLKAKTPVEMIFEMPIEIGGEIGAQVACRGEIVRSVVSGKDHAGNLFAASIVEYRFRRGGVRRVAGVGFQSVAWGNPFTNNKIRTNQDILVWTLDCTAACGKRYVLLPFARQG